MTGGANGRWFPDGLGVGSAEHLLFCFPHAGGDSGVFRRWKAELAPRIEVVPAQLPGRESRFAEPPLTSAAAVAAEVLAPLSAYAHRPFALFGHSMGALLAYELALALTDRGAPPAHLFVSGRQPPHLPTPDLVLHGLTDQEFAEQLAGFEGMPDELLDDPEMMNFLMPRFRADLEICETYPTYPRPPVPVPITVLAGRQDPDIDVSVLNRWGELTTESTEIHLLDCGHFWYGSPHEVRVQKIVASTLRGTSRR